MFNKRLKQEVVGQAEYITWLQEQNDKLLKSNSQLAGEIVEAKLAKHLGYKEGMKKYTLKYSHNNSGGRDWITPKQWRTFKQWGYTVQEPYTAERQAWATCQSMALAILKRDFTEITGQTGDELGCACCGPPHWLYAEEGWDE
jgi:hypothetical protein